MESGSTEHSYEGGYEEGNLDSNSGKLGDFEAWGWSMLFVTIINLSSVTGILFFPIMKKSVYKVMMRLMIGLAIGSLGGSALFHLIPAAFGLDKTKDKREGHINVALCIWVSIWIVMILECAIKIFLKQHHVDRHAQMSIEMKGTNNNEEVSLGQSGSQKLFGRETSSQPDLTNINQDDENYVSDSESQRFKSQENSLGMHQAENHIPVYHSTFSLNKGPTECHMETELTSTQTVKTVAWLVIIGDSLHNFIDGISIGAAFVTDYNTGVVISLAIMCEEFPHELGDFAILINSGFTLKKALVANFLSALTCYLGMVVGILLGEIEWANYIFAFAAGIFLYVSLAEMIPDITGMIEVEYSTVGALKVLLTHNLGILVGIMILYVLATVQLQ